MPAARDRCIASYAARWGEPAIVARAPGRVNLIGEHTDYNDGFALPMAIGFDTVIALGSVGDPHQGPVTVVSEGFGTAELDPAAEPSSSPDWARHVAGIVHLAAAEGLPAAGWRATIATDIPVGAGLSSSAALEVATVTALLARSGREWPPLAIARLGQRVENEVVGVPSGIMDQLISAGAVAGHASLMDCRALTLEPTPMPAGVAVAVLDTKTRRSLVEGSYRDRREACDRVSRLLGARALRDVGIGDLAAVADPTDRSRARHVITENDRTVAAAAAMWNGDAVEVGRLMAESHRSLRDDFAVSGPGLDAIVEVATAAPGSLGARMTGGGFAGCAVALVEAAATERFADAVRDGYRYGGHTAEVWVCAPAAGAAIIG
jgi:galactokinase